VERHRRPAARGYDAIDQELGGRHVAVLCSGRQHRLEHTFDVLRGERVKARWREPRPIERQGLFADAGLIGSHLTLLAGILPAGVLTLFADQITLVLQQRSGTLGTAFILSLMIALGSANSGISALFDALNVVYGEKEKRSLLRFYALTFLFTLVGILLITTAIIGVVILPLVLKFVGLEGEESARHGEPPFGSH
jgi:Virulence factor BrkB